MADAVLYTSAALLGILLLCIAAAFIYACRHPVQAPPEAAAPVGEGCSSPPAKASKLANLVKLLRSAPVVALLQSLLDKFKIACVAALALQCNSKESHL